MQERLEVRVNIMAALAERLSKQSLGEWLIDNAEDVIEETRPGFHEEDVDSTTVCADGADFLVRFAMPDAPGRPVWKKIQDDRVQHVWKKADDDDCEECPGTVVVPPGWYEDNGTPTCDCGQDMAYSHTEILKRKKQNKPPKPKEETN